MAVELLAVTVLPVEFPAAGVNLQVDLHQPADDRARRSSVVAAKPESGKRHCNLPLHTVNTVSKPPAPSPAPPARTPPRRTWPALARDLRTIEAHHHVRDVTSGEDAVASRTGSGPVNLATIRAAITAAIKDVGYLHTPEGRRDRTTPAETLRLHGLD
jgi:hypothetical protein